MHEKEYFWVERNDQITKTDIATFMDFLMEPKIFLEASQSVPEQQDLSDE